MTQIFYVDGDNGKDVFITCAESDDFRLTLDFDDVNRHEAAYRLRKALTILNDHWHSDTYAHLNPPEKPDDYDDDDAYDAESAEAETILRELGKQETH